MPLYDYWCNTCQIRFEALARLDERLSCPHCQSEQVDRQITAHRSVIGDNTPHRAAHRELDRQQAKRSRLDGYYKNGKWS